MKANVPPGLQDARDAREHLFERPDIDQHVGREHDIESGGGSTVEERFEVGDGEGAVKASRPCLLDHARRKIDAIDGLDALCKGACHQSGPAAEIEDDTARLVSAALERLDDQARPTILQGVRQVLVEASRVLIEQPADVGRRHCDAVVSRFPARDVE